MLAERAGLDEVIERIESRTTVSTRFAKGENKEKTRRKRGGA